MYKRDTTRMDSSQYHVQYLFIGDEALGVVQKWATLSLRGSVVVGELMDFGSKTAHFSELSAKTQIWYGRISEVVEDSAAAVDWLSRTEKERCQSYLREVDRLSFTAGRILLKRALSFYINTPPHTWEMMATPFGAPVIVDEQNPFGLKISLSKSTRWVAVAVAQSRCGVGVDIEDMTRAIDLEVDPRTILSPDELTFMNALPREDQLAHFFKIWCLKEAYVKARGVGFHQKPEHVTIQLDEGGGARVTVAGPRLSGARAHAMDYGFAVHDPTPSTLIAAAHDLGVDGPVGFAFRDFQDLPRMDR
jgi:4'-phosphopantetheinyl transferase